MTIGMKHQEFEDCELACCVCGKQDKLVVVAYRDKTGKVIGYLFVCNKDCFNFVQKEGLVIQGLPK